VPVDAPETRYVERPDGVSIAYQVVGSGPRDVVYVPGFISHLDLVWSEPHFVAWLRRLAAFARVIMYDKPGTGLSDPIEHVPLVEERRDDIRTVIDAVGSERPVLMGFSEGVPSALLFAATWPERVESLVLYGGIVKGSPTPEDLAGTDWTLERVAAHWARMGAALDEWGRGRTVELMCPSVDTPAERRFWALFERASASPRMARSLIAAVKALDVTPVLGSVTTPALLIHNVDDYAPVFQSRLAAARLPNARLVELPGCDHAFWMHDPDPVADEIEQFVTGARRSAQTDRVLATVLFTDVVGSTERAAELGDARWRMLLERHDALVRRLVELHGGRVVKAMGDGHLSAFEGPARGIRCALALREESELPVRAGLHTGECEALGDDLGGLAVHIGARVGALAGAGEVLVSGTVKDLVVGSGLAFSDRGEHELKGVPGRWRVHAVGAAGAPVPVAAERELRPGDRIALRMANRAPETMRTAARVARRFSRSRR
jgi:class 3 adenylate cyclase